MGTRLFLRLLEKCSLQDMAVDLVTLLEYLKSTDNLDKAGGVTYISEISSSVITTANLEAYIKIVEDKSLLRKLIKSSTAIIEESYNKQDKVDRCY